MPKYKALIFDLDDTAIPNALDSVPSQRLVEAVKNAAGKLKLCAATGRPYAYAKDILLALELTEPCVISAGTQIIDPTNGEILWEVIIDPADVAQILEICKPYRYEIIIKNEMIGQGRAASDHVVIDSTNVMYIISSELADTETILETLKAIEGITAIGIPSWTHKGTDIHITNRQATKEHSIAELLRIIGVSKDKVIGVGDGDNDINLFKSVGLKIAMGNATDLLMSEADEICDTVENDGLAKIIDRFSTHQ